MTEKVFQTITDAPTVFTIRVSSPGILRLVGIRKVKLRIRGIFTATLLKIAPLIQSIKIETDAGSTMVATALQGMEKNILTQSRVVAMAILNGPVSIRLFTTPLAWFLRNNLDANGMMQLVTVVLDRMNITDFMSSIVLTGGLKIAGTKTSLESDTGEKIAPGS